LFRIYFGAYAATGRRVDSNNPKERKRKKGLQHVKPKRQAVEKNSVSQPYITHPHLPPINKVKQQSFLATPLNKRLLNVKPMRRSGDAASFPFQFLGTESWLES
jgi:hypothetical protein